jgi:hypothetical protein
MKLMKLEAVIAWLKKLNYTLELRSPGHFVGAQYSAYFWHEAESTCSECGSFILDSNRGHKHADTLEEAILEAAREIITVGKYEVEVEDFE